MSVERRDPKRIEAEGTEMAYAKVVLPTCRGPTKATEGLRLRLSLIFVSSLRFIIYVNLT